MKILLIIIAIITISYYFSPKSKTDLSKSKYMKNGTTEKRGDYYYYTATQEEFDECVKDNPLTWTSSCAGFYPVKEINKLKN